MTMSELEDLVLSLQRQVSACADRASIENLMGRYQYLHTAHHDETILAELWSDADDITLEEGANGVYCKDRNGIADYYRKKFGSKKPPLPGQMDLCMISTPVIEIAGDGKTAKGIWSGFGCESAVYPAGIASGIPSIDESPADNDGAHIQADWVMKKYGADFIKSDNGWKILHLHIYDVLRCSFYEDWVRYSARRFADDEARDSLLRLGVERITAERPTTFHWQYAKDATPPLEPCPPAPYETLSSTQPY